jgi:hypothetical protein
MKKKTKTTKKKKTTTKNNTDNPLGIQSQNITYMYSTIIALQY